MTLTPCPECSRMVSTAAPTCPGCGVPIAHALAAKATGTVVTTTQATSKRLKLHTLGAAGLTIISMVWLMVQAAAESPDSALIGVPALLLPIGIIWFGVTRFRIWWHHR